MAQWTRDYARLPGIPDEQYWFQRHLVAYELAARR
jgi:hypothetical protein